MLCVISALLFGTQALANEDTAQLTFSKTAVSKKPSHKYTVQEGDVLSVIIRRIPSVTEKNVSRYYQMTKELNPAITDLDKLYAGQKILLPGKSVAVKEEKASTSTTSVNDSSLESAGSQPYQVKKGDSLIRIVHRELHIKTNTQKTLLLIKSLNPHIKNPHKIYVGQVIRLPEGHTAGQAGEPTARSAKTIEQESHSLSMSEEQQVQTDKSITGKDSVILHPAVRLDVIKHIITQMNGNMITSGNYYLPVSKTEQVTIDCSIIPVVELDDQTTIFLDAGNRSNDLLKKMISDHWSNFHLVKIDIKDDIIIMLKKIFKNTKSYEITKAQKPLSLGPPLPLEVMVDWVIAKKGAKRSSSKTQGLRFVYENSPLLPRAIVNYARQHALIITEISPEKGLVGKPEEIYSLPPMPVLPKSSAKDFSVALLSYLNVQGEKDADVRVFNIAQDGFNLSIKADFVVTNGAKKTILFSRNLPPQFVNVLQKAGNELIFLSDGDEPAKNLEKILRSFNFAFTTGHFTFSGLDKNQPPYSFGFDGTKIKTDKDIYFVNFDFHQDLRGLMQETWSSSMVRY